MKEIFWLKKRASTTYSVYFRFIGNKCMWNLCESFIQDYIERVKKERQFRLHAENNPPNPGHYSKLPSL